MSSRFSHKMPEPRGITREAAACYCGLSKEGFDEWVKRGLVPGPIAGTQRWDLKAIDFALDRASGLRHPDESLSPFAEWNRNRAR